MMDEEDKMTYIFMGVFLVALACGIAIDVCSMYSSERIELARIAASDAQYSGGGK